MPLVSGERDGGKLGIGDLDPSRVGASVKLGVYLQARAGRGRADQVTELSGP
jgi:hypothetical protein